MPIPGLSLVGFMNEGLALLYLRTRCVYPTATDADLLQRWADAKARLPAPSGRAGIPEIKDIPAEHADYLAGVRSHPRFRETAEFTQSTFKLIEIAPLLAFQFHVETERSSAVCGMADGLPDVSRMMPTTLPQTLENIPFSHSMAPTQTGFSVKCKSLNLRVLGGGLMGQDVASGKMFIGAACGPAQNLVAVARVDGRCYLCNGFHRMYGLQQAGATHVPCLLFDAPGLGQIGVLGGEATFDEATLASANPPTCGHLARASAYEVPLRRATRVISVSWSEYVHLDEE